MPQTMYCNGHPDRPAVTLIQQLGTPDVMTLCFECVIGWAAGVIAAVEQLPPAQGAESDGGTDDAESTDPLDYGGPTRTGIEWVEVDGVRTPVSELDFPEGGDIEDGSIRAHNRGAGDVHRPAPSEAGAVDGGAGSGGVAARDGTGDGAAVGVDS